MYVLRIIVTSHKEYFSTQYWRTGVHNGRGHCCLCCTKYIFHCNLGERQFSVVRDSRCRRPGSSQSNSCGACVAQNFTGIGLLRSSCVFSFNIIQHYSILILSLKTLFADGNSVWKWEFSEQKQCFFRNWVHQEGKLFLLSMFVE
jgi:hypothetical protein